MDGAGPFWGPAKKTKQRAQPTKYTSDDMIHFIGAATAREAGGSRRSLGSARKRRHHDQLCGNSGGDW